MTIAAKNHPVTVGLSSEKTVVLAVASRTNAMLRHKRPSGAEALEVSAALKWLERLMDTKSAPEAAVIMGPGEPLATATDTTALISSIGERYPELKICLSTNGLGLPAMLNDPAAAMLSEVTLQVNAADPEIAMSVYAWIRPGKRTLPLAEGVRVLLDDQVASAERLSGMNIPVIVESRCIPGVNQGHLPEVAALMSENGAGCMRLISGFTETAECGGVFLEKIREKCAVYLKMVPEIQKIESLPPEVFLDGNRPCVAVASTDGASVDAHLGQATVLMVYEMQGGAVTFVGARETPAPGTEGRWLKLADVLSDCRAVLVAHAGESPRKVLSGKGIRLLESEGGIESAVKKVFTASSGHNEPTCGGPGC